jgi:hypothetical protein
MEPLAKGTCIYNGGDACNPSHFGTVTEVRVSEWGTDYVIAPDDRAELGAYFISSHMLSPEYKGHGGTRIVTEAAYHAFYGRPVGAWSRPERDEEQELLALVEGPALDELRRVCAAPTKEAARGPRGDQWTDSISPTATCCCSTRPRAPMAPTSAPAS